MSYMKVLVVVQEVQGTFLDWLPVIRPHRPANTKIVRSGSDAPDKGDSRNHG